MCVPVQQPTTDVTSTLQHTTTWQFHESDWQDTEEVAVSGPLLWNSPPLTVRDASLTLTQFCARVEDFCFPEPTGHHHSASVTFSGVKFARTQIYLLTYLLHRFGLP